MIFNLDLDNNLMFLVTVNRVKIVYVLFLLAQFYILYLSLRSCLRRNKKHQLGRSEKTLRSYDNQYFGSDKLAMLPHTQPY